VKTLEEHSQEIEEISIIFQTHLRRWNSLILRHTEEICSLVEWGTHILFLPEEKEQEFRLFMLRQLNHLEELGEAMEDVGKDMEKLGMHSKEFCETILEELKNGE